MMKPSITNTATLNITKLTLFCALGKYCNKIVMQAGTNRAIEYVIKLDDIFSFRLSVQYMSDRITPRPPKIMITNRKYNVKLIVHGILSRYHNS